MNASLLFYMTRPLRIEYEDAWYHIMNRGVDHQAIFYDPRDYQLFYNLIGQTHDRYKIEVHAFCLMTNHYHLLKNTLFKSK